MLKVMVAEDSPTALALLLEILKSDPGIEVIGTASNGADAVRMTTALKPDLITMDVHMPGMDGLQATREIMSSVPTPILIVSSAARGDAALSLSATEAGALMVVPKPEGPHSGDFDQQRDYLLRMVHAMAQVRVVRRWAPRVASPLAVTRRRAPLGSPDAKVVALAASTGGPAALRQILHALPGDFDLPVLVVQHIAKGFTPGLAHWLALTSGPRVVIPTHGAELKPGHVYVAPDDRHLGMAADLTAVVSASLPVGQFRPSANYLFSSVASAVEGAAVAAVLTGMGDDGVTGLRDLHRAGGLVLAQDEASSVVFGMAREAIRAGVVDEILPLDGIADALLGVVREARHG